MNELVVKLSAKKHVVEAKRPFKTIEALKGSVDRNYVHINFKDTGTELGTTLSRRRCQIEQANFESGTGVLHLEGGLILNYQKIKVLADIDLSTLEGTGIVVPINDEEYKTLFE